MAVANVSSSKSKQTYGRRARGTSPAFSQPGERGGDMTFEQWLKKYDGAVLVVYGRDLVLHEPGKEQRLAVRGNTVELVRELEPGQLAFEAYYKACGIFYVDMWRAASVDERSHWAAVEATLKGK